MILNPRKPSPKFDRGQQIPTSLQKTAICWGSPEMGLKKEHQPETA